MRAVGTTKIFTPGVFEQTGNALDVAIEGDGFFKVNLPDGSEAYTRDGAFHVDPSGQLVTGDGLFVASSVTISQDVNVQTVHVGRDGSVSARNPDGTSQTLGQLELFRFSNPAGLRNEGGNLYTATDASGTEIPGNPGEDGFGTVRNQFLERSNVEVVTELIGLITAQRAYEINSRAVRAADEMLSVTSDMVR